MKSQKSRSRSPLFAGAWDTVRVTDVTMTWHDINASAHLHVAQRALQAALWSFQREQRSEDRGELPNAHHVDVRAEPARPFDMF